MPWLLGAARRLAAQEASTDADPIVLMNRAVEQYMEEEWDACLETLNTILAADEDDQAAQFFRAVVHGQRAELSETDARNGPKGDFARARRDLGHADRIRSVIVELGAAQRASNRDRFEQARSGLPTDDVAIAEFHADLQRVIETLAEVPLVDEAGVLDEAGERLDTFRDRRRGDLETAVRATAPMDAATQAHYEAMHNDLVAVTDAFLAREDTFVRLVEGVVAIKLGQYTAQPTADEKVEGLLRDVELSAERHQRLTQVRARWLADAAEALEFYIHPPETIGAPPDDMERVKAEFYLGVVRYRQAFAPARVPGQTELLVDEGALRQAEMAMVGLTERLTARPDDPDRDEEVQRWKSYPMLYLGLIRTVQRRFDDARAFYTQARELDTRDDGRSRSLIIPILVDQQLARIAEIEATAPVAEFGDDILIALKTGIALDSNVILLGEDTSTPLDIGRSGDVVAQGGIAVHYTLDLGMLDRSFERWRIGLGGRASSTWHGDIREFNEQDYGGSIAIEYKLIGREPNEAHGPLMASVQYDYDYFLLGNDGFLRVNRVTPRLTLLTHEQRRASTLEFRYEDRNYLEPLLDRRFDRDGNYFAFRAAHSIEWVDLTPVYKDRGITPWGHANDPGPEDVEYSRWLRTSVGAEYGWDATVGDEFDANRFLFTVTFDVPLPRGVTLSLGGEWEWQEYRKASLIDFHRHFRDDFIQRYRIALERRFVLESGRATHRRTRSIDRRVLVLRGDLQLTDDASNVEDRLGQSVFRYDRTVFGLSVSVLFN